MTSVTYCAAATLVAACFALAQDAPPAQPAPPPAASPTPTPLALTGHALRLAVDLGLTAEQGAQVQKMFDDQTRQLQPLYPQLRVTLQAIQRLAEGGATGEAFDTQLQTLAGTQASLVSQISVIRAKTTAKIWALLTPEQRVKASQTPGLLNPEEPGMGARNRPQRNRMMRPVRPVQPQ